MISIIAGLIAGSVSLVGFGLDSIIEVTSGAALLWRLHHDRNESRRAAVERITLRVVGWGFIALAVYITCDSGLTLARHEIPQRSIPGIILAATSPGGHAIVSESEAPGRGGNQQRRHEG